MKKKFLAVVLAMVTLLSTSFAEAYALGNNGGAIAPCYSGVSSVTSYMDIDDCILIYNIDVIPFSKTSLDRVHIEAELKTLGGKVVKSYDEDLTKSTSLFTFSKRRAVSEEATYFLRYTLTCYKTGNVIDEITQNTKTATYTRQVGENLNVR